MEQINFSETILTEVSYLLRPLLYLNSGEKIKSFFEKIGYTISETDLTDVFSSIVTISEDIVNGVLELSNAEAGSERADAIAGLIDTIKDAVDEINNIESAIRSSSLLDSGFKNNAPLEEFPKRLLDYLIFTDLYNEYPKIFGMLYLTGVLEEKQLEENASIFQPECKLKVIYWDRITRIFSEPEILIDEVFNWSDDFDNASFLSRIDLFLSALAIPGGFYTQSSDVKSALGNTSTDIPEIRIPVLSQGIYPATYSQFGLDLTPVESKSGKKAGLAVIPYLLGTTSFDFEIDENWEGTFNSSLSLESGVGMIIRPPFSIEVLENIFLSPQSSGSLDISLTAKQTDSTDSEFSEIFIFGDEERDHVYIKDFSITFYASISSAAQDIGIDIDIGTLKVLMSITDGDNFIKNILGSAGIDSTFEIGTRFSLLNGISFKGSSYLEISIPVHIEIGPVEINMFLINIEPEPEKLVTEVSATINAELGPLSLEIQNIGIKSELSFPENRTGNLGPIDAILSFKPPSGIEISIESNGFNGGGFLYFDDEKKEYSGGLELEFQDIISLKAIGILTTLMPDGSSGFSLLIIITAEFTPIQLGFGFTLNGVGGLIGINRTCEIDVLQAGVKDGTIDNILFPQDIVANAVQIVTDVKKVFPVQEDQFVFGPMAEIGWGTPTLITVQLGLLIEIPNPVRLAILGVLKALLPDDNFKLLSLQVNFLGVIDFENCSLSFDASIYESKLLTYTLTGDMALRLNWGNDPVFVLSVGGFHPSYDPPANLGISNMERLTISLFPTNNPRLSIETYFAVTSNTVQFGAKGELYVGVSKFDVEGNIGFDVLFQFSPFYFIAQCYANLSVSAFGEDILSVSLNLKLDGPTPWHAKGTASFKVIVKFEINVDETFGDTKNTTLEPIDVKPLLEEEFSNTGNWKAEIPEESNLQVTLRSLDTSSDQIIAHPFGILTVSQKLVPLDLTISKFGSQSVSGDDNFSISKVEVGSESLTFSDTKEEFAPAQYFNLSNAEKLSNKDFEDYNSGVSIDGSGELNADYVVEREAEYELEYLHRKRIFKFIGINSDIFGQLLKGSAMSKSILSSGVNSASVLGTQKISMSSEQFTITNVNDMALYNEDYIFTSEREAILKMEEITVQNPSLKNELQVIPSYGVNV